MGSSHQLLPHLLLHGFLGDHGDSAGKKPLQSGQGLGDRSFFLCHNSPSPFLYQQPLVGGSHSSAVYRERWVCGSSCRSPPAVSPPARDSPRLPRCQQHLVRKAWLLPGLLIPAQPQPCCGPPDASWVCAMAVRPGRRELSRCRGAGQGGWCSLDVSTSSDTISIAGHMRGKLFDRNDP